METGGPLTLSSKEVPRGRPAQGGAGQTDHHRRITNDKGPRPVPVVAADYRSSRIVQDAAVVRTLLAHAGRARSPEAPGPAPPARAAID
jgi:hypothetical protein